MPIPCPKFPFIFNYFLPPTVFQALWTVSVPGIWESEYHRMAIVSQEIATIQTLFANDRSHSLYFFQITVSRARRLKESSAISIMMSYWETSKYSLARMLNTHTYTHTYTHTQTHTLLALTLNTYVLWDKLLTFLSLSFLRNEMIEGYQKEWKLATIILICPNIIWITRMGYNCRMWEYLHLGA